MTERHRKRLGDLGNDIHRSHNHDGFRKTLQPTHETVVFNIVVPDDHRDHQRPHNDTADISGSGAQETSQTDQSTANGREENSTDKGHPMGIMRAHSFHHHIVEHHDTLFYQHLLTVGALLQALAQVNACPAQQDGHQ